MPNATINVSVSNHYREANYASETTSQGLLGERVEVLESGLLFSKIRQSDDHISWVSSEQLFFGNMSQGQTLIVTEHLLRIYQKPDRGSLGIRDAVFGCNLIQVGEKSGWYNVVLPDGQLGWAEKAGFGSLPEFSSESILNMANQFLGVQYAWGGRSTKGFDCSGFVQMVFGLHGVGMQRDSWQQQQEHVVSRDYQDAQAADLLFFGASPDRVAHVAIYVGDGRYIHASGWVKYNSLNEKAEDFSEKRLKQFISVNRYSVV